MGFWKFQLDVNRHFFSVFLDVTSNLLDALQDRSWPETCVLSRTVKTDIHIAQWHLERNCFLVYFSKFNHLLGYFEKVNSFECEYTYILFNKSSNSYWFGCYINKKLTFYGYHTKQPTSDDQWRFSPICMMAREIVTKNPVSSLEPWSGRARTVNDAPRCPPGSRGAVVIDLWSLTGGVLIKLTGKEKLDTKHSN